jgi:GMP synthase-like glutamine amidotransferase
MKVAALFHVSFEKLGTIEDWIIRKGHSLTEYHLYHDPRLPKAEDFDLLIIMGGPMGIKDESEFPWLKSEKALIAKRIETGRAVIGICLGAQLVASVLGSAVIQAKNKEIGWFPIKLNGNKELKSMFPGLPDEITVFHWHGEIFDPPAGSVSFASSAITPCQGFIFHQHVLAFQFHPEIKPENISLMINHAGDELVPGPYIQDAGILSAGLTHMPENRQMMETFLTYFETYITRKTRHGNH